MTRLSDAELLAHLVAFDTTSGNSNLPLVDFVCDYLDGSGARIHRMPSPDAAKANLAVVAGPGSDDGGAANDREGLTLCGHTDVVPAREPGWSSDPFAATRSDGTIVGRGTADMKGFLALAIQALVEADRRTLSKPLALLFNHTGVVIGMVHVLLPYAIIPLYASMSRIDARPTGAGPPLTGAILSPPSQEVA